MAKIPYTEPSAPRMTRESVSPLERPSAMAMGSEAAARAAESLGRSAEHIGELVQRQQQLADNQAITKETLNGESRLDALTRQITESGDYQGALNTYSQGLQQYDSYLKQNYSGEVLTSIQNRILAKSITQKNQLAAWSHNAMMEDAKLTQQQALDHQTSSYAYAGPGADRARIASQVKQQLIGDVGTLFANPDEANAAYDKWLKDSDYQAAIWDMEQNPGGAYMRLEKGDYHLEADHRASLEHRAQMLKKQFDDENKVKAVQLIKSNMERVMLGFGSDEQVPKTVSGLLSDQPEERDMLLQANKFAQKFYGLQTSWNQLSDQEALESVDKFKPDNPNNPYELAAVAKARSDVGKFIADRAKDPASFIRGNDPQTKIAVEMRLGLPLKPYTNDQAKEIGANIIEQQTVPGKIAAIRHISEEAGHYGIQQVVKAAKLPPSIILLPQMNPNDASVYSDWMQLPKKAQEEQLSRAYPASSVSKSKNQLDQEVSSALQPYLTALGGTSDQTQLMYTHAAEGLTIDYKLRGQANPAENAVEGLFPDMKLVNGQLMPKQADADSVHYNLQHAFDGIDKNSLAGGDGYWQVLQAQHQWVLTDTGQGDAYVLHSPFGVVYHKNHQPVMVTLDEMTKKVAPEKINPVAHDIFTAVEYQEGIP